MHKTLMLQGRYIPKEERFQIRIKGVFGKRLPKKAVVGNSCDVTIRGHCLSSALKEVPKYLDKRAVQAMEMLCLSEIREAKVNKILDGWARRGMMFFVWRSHYEDVLTFLGMCSSTEFEVDEVLEALIDVATIDPRIPNFRGNNAGLVSYDISRVFEMDETEVLAHEIIVQHGKSSLDIGYLGFGGTLAEAMSRVSIIIPF